MYEEYMKEHPEELTKLNALKAYSDMVEKEMGKRRKKRLNKVDKWRRKLYEEPTRK